MLIVALFPLHFRLILEKIDHFTCHAWMTMDEWKPADLFHCLRHFQSCGQGFLRFFVKRKCRVEKKTHLGWNIFILKTKGAKDQWLRQFQHLWGNTFTLVHELWKVCLFWSPFLKQKTRAGGDFTCVRKTNLRAKNKQNSERHAKIFIFIYSHQTWKWVTNLLRDPDRLTKKNTAYMDCDPSKLAVPTAVVFFLMLAALPEVGSHSLSGNKLSEKHDVGRLHLMWPRRNKANKKQQKHAPTKSKNKLPTKPHTTPDRTQSRLDHV